MALILDASAGITWIKGISQTNFLGKKEMKIDENKEKKGRKKWSKRNINKRFWYSELKN